jgi:3-hydroxy acid dehydrogenase / malonic semialdehyde reductase
MSMNTSTKTVLITGATAGIGEACARHFAEKGCKLILTGRRSDRLNSLAEDLQSRFQSQITHPDL